MTTPSRPADRGQPIVDSLVTSFRIGNAGAREELGGPPLPKAGEGQRSPMAT